MNLLNNYILIKPASQFPALKLLNGSIVTQSELSEEEKIAVAPIIGTDIAMNPQGKAVKYGEVIAVPETLDNDLVHKRMYGGEDAGPSKAKYAYSGIRFDYPQLQPGDLLYFHYNAGQITKDQGRVFKSIPSHPELVEGWFLEYNPFRWLYAFIRNGQLHPFEFNIIMEAVTQERFSEILYTPKDGSKKEGYGKIVNAGKCDSLKSLPYRDNGEWKFGGYKNGDIIRHSKYTDIKLTVGDKEYFVMDGLCDVAGIIR